MLKRKKMLKKNKLIKYKRNHYNQMKMEIHLLCQMLKMEKYHNLKINMIQNYKIKMEIQQPQFQPNKVLFLQQNGIMIH